MRVVLGIDAAWTLTRPSGVALVAERGGRWDLVAAAASYAGFHARAAGAPEPRPVGAPPDAAALLRSARALCGGVDLVAMDMPLALTPIAGRRACDDAVSRAYGARKCGTYTPSALRPGPISDTLRAEFVRTGYPLRTASPLVPGIIEVYPHPALLVLCNAGERLPYKAAKTRTYWPASDLGERRTRLFRQWTKIVALLDREIAGVADVLPPLSADARGATVKAYEDTLDAVICAWIGIRALQGRALCFGDDSAAIWVPSPAEPGDADRPVPVRGTRAEPEPVRGWRIS